LFIKVKQSQDWSDVASSIMKPLVAVAAPAAATQRITTAATTATNEDEVDAELEMLKRAMLACKAREEAAHALILLRRRTSSVDEASHLDPHSGSDGCCCYIPLRSSDTKGFASNHDSSQCRCECTMREGEASTVRGATLLLNARGQVCVVYFSYSI
jgi:hypothetical protein